jgi:hypothetical protein
VTLDGRICHGCGGPGPLKKYRLMGYYMRDSIRWFCAKCSVGHEHNEVKR